MRLKPWTQPTLTKESFGEAVDINSLARRAFGGQVIPMRDQVAQYGDFTRAQTLQDALELVDAAKLGFQNLPASIRAEFRNDPVSLVQFMDDVKSGAEGARPRAIALGLVNPSREEVMYMAAIEKRDQIASLPSLPAKESSSG